MEQTVELYCGPEKPFSKIAAALGYSAISVDPLADANPTVVGPIGEELASSLPTAPLIVWAAPPFNKVLVDRSAWEDDGSFYPKTEEAHLATNQIRDTIRLLTPLKPTWWFIEQPKSLARTMPMFAGFNRGYPTRNRHTILHKQFGGSSEGTSDVWTNAFWWLPQSETPHIGFLSGEKTPRVPPYVYAQMFEQFDRYMVAQNRR